MLRTTRALALIGVLLSGITFFSIYASAEESLIPSWIKNTAGFWIDEQVSDSEFINALQFLITNGIIQVPNDELKELQDENNQLQTEIASLKSQLSGQMQIGFKEFYSKAYGFSLNVPESWHENSGTECRLLLSELPKEAGSTFCVVTDLSKSPLDYGKVLLDIIYETKSDICQDSYKKLGYSCDGFKARKLELVTMDKVMSYYISYQEDRGPIGKETKITHTFWEIYVPTSLSTLKITMETIEDNFDEYDVIMDEAISSFKFVSKKHG